MDTIPDFEDVDFCDGTGWNVIAAIHLAIKERMECVQHPTLMTAGDYDEAFTGDIWIGDPHDGDGRLYLLRQFQKFYTDISTLVEGNDFVRWTVVSAGDDIWTVDDLVTDIGMGEFADLLHMPTEAAPIVWLQECLNRLIYARRYKSDVFGGPPSGAGSPTRSFYYKQGGDPGRNSGDPLPDYSHAQDAWSAMLADTESLLAAPTLSGASVISANVSASTFGIIAGSVHRMDGGYLREAYSSPLVGDWTRAEWEVIQSAGSDCTLTSIDIVIDGGAPVSIPLTNVLIDWDYIFVEAEEGAVPLNGTRDDVTIGFDSLPSSLPFDGHTTFGGGFEDGTGSLGIRLHRARVYFDIAGELTDQL